MKPLSLMFCFLLLSVFANSTITVTVNGTYTYIIHPEKNEKKPTLKEKIRSSLFNKFHTPDELEKRRANKLAKIGVALSVAGMFLLPPLSIAGIILSIIALRKEKKHPGILSKKNKDHAIAGVIYGFLGILLLAVLYIIIFHFLLQLNLAAGLA
jgi:hypothetical protein